MRVVMRVGFQVANPVTRVAKKGTQYPAGFIVPDARSPLPNPNDGEAHDGA